VVNGDADELSEVIHNLIDNAIKYGHDGSEIAVRGAGYSLSRPST